MYHSWCLEVTDILACQLRAAYLVDSQTLVKTRHSTHTQYEAKPEALEVLRALTADVERLGERKVAAATAMYDLLDQTIAIVDEEVRVQHGEALALRKVSEEALHGVLQTAEAQQRNWEAKVSAAKAAAAAAKAAAATAIGAPASAGQGSAAAAASGLGSGVGSSSGTAGTSTAGSVIASGVATSGKSSGSGRDRKRRRKSGSRSKDRRSKSGTSSRRDGGGGGGDGGDGGPGAVHGGRSERLVFRSCLCCCETL